MHMTRIHNHFEIITEEGATEVLGTPRSVPLSPQAMAQSLRVTFSPLCRQASRYGVLHNT